MENKKRLYAPNQEYLDIIKAEMKLIGKKSNNSTAVNEAVLFLAKTIEIKKAGERAYKKEQKKEKKKQLKKNPLILKAK
tara:strand:- start:257 stop:493 length:237 start_codon:yes stop_codon:yes gene_type:complete